MGGNTFLAPHKAQFFGGGCLDVDTAHSHSEVGCDALAHSINVLAQSRGLGDHGKVNVNYCPTGFIQLCDHCAHERSTVSITKGRIGIGKMPADITEARRTLAVEKERLAREASEHHESAMAETQRLVTEAEQRAASAEERGRQATASATQYREQSQAEADALLQRARREAEQIVSSAQKQAESISSTGTAEAERELAAVRAEVERLQKRRDGITAQLSSLADIVSGFGSDEPEAAADAAQNDES